MNDRIFELRKALKLTQTEFGKALGITASGVSDIESGRRVVQDRHIKLILAAFPKVSENWIRSGEGSMFLEEHRDAIAEIVKKYSFGDIVGKLLEAFDDLDPDAQEIVLQYTQRFVGKILEGFSVDEAVTAIEPPEIDIDAEVEKYREQLEAQKKTGSSLLPGTGATGRTGTE